MESEKVLAPAKINLSLKVLGRRPDGYHEIESLVVCIGLFDELHMVPGRHEGIVLRCPGCSSLENDGNLALRAARLFARKVTDPGGLLIYLDKRIPLGSGLGGGSSDAAAVLRWLNEKTGNPLGLKQLRDLGAELGADVPFFIEGRPAIMRGVGDVIDRMSFFPPLWVVVVYPSVEISSRWAYQAYDEAFPEKSDSELRLTNGAETGTWHLSVETMAGLVGLVRNDLERLCLRHFSGLEELRTELVISGAEAVSMTGSGSAFFGLFATEAEAMTAKDRLRMAADWRCFVAPVLC